MIVVLSVVDEPPLTDLDRFDRLHAEVTGSFDAVEFGRLCRRCDDEHVWLDIARARATGAEHSDAFVAQFDEMIRFAADHGWLDDDATHVRAHVASPDPATDPPTD